MIKRITYAISLAWQHRKSLSNYRNNAALQVKTVLELDLYAEKARGIKVLVLDMDGVLSAYGETEVNPDIENWLNSCVTIFGLGQVFILSNQPNNDRTNFFSSHFHGIHFIIAKKKKPYPDGIQQILQLASVNPKELLLIDDRLLTGILAAIIVNTEARYVTNPLVSLAIKPIHELYFIFLRKLERWVFRFI